jgi:hypothetical protein
VDEITYPAAPTLPPMARSLYVQGFLLGSVAAREGVTVDQQLDQDGTYLPWADVTVHGQTARVRVTGVPRPSQPASAEDLRADLAREFEEEGGVEHAVFTALGAASACWEDLGGAGVFDSTRAKAIGDALVAWLLDWRS